MDPETKRLMELLDLDGESTPAPNPLKVTQHPQEAPKRTPSAASMSESALRLDKWDILQGAHVLALHPKVLAGLSVPAVADFHTAAYLQDPTLLESCTDERRRQFLEALFQTPEYQALHAKTAYNALASEMACLDFGREFLKLQEKDRGRKPGKRSEQRAELDLLLAADRAAKQASEEVEDLEDMLLAVGGQGIGNEQGTDGKLNREEVIQLYRRVRNHHLLKRIFDKAGRFRLFAQAQQRQKVLHGVDDMVGVELGGDVDRLLPTELAKLSDPLFEDDAMRRIVERQCLQRKHKGVERLGKGPIIACIDESGSMDGQPVCDAKAFALSLAYLARSQKRWCA
jgi:uncharacterized protein with von Willebrand factor type A (vWA) domain